MLGTHTIWVVHHWSTCSKQSLAFGYFCINQWPSRIPRKFNQKLSPRKKGERDPVVALNPSSWNYFEIAKARLGLLSISSTFYEQLLRQYSSAKKLQSQIVTREKLRETLSNKKGTLIMLMKLTPIVTIYEYEILLILSFF